MEVREMLPREKSEVKKVMNRAFPFLMRLFFHFTTNNLVVVENNIIVGGVVLQKFKISRERAGGLICLIFSDPDYHGKGVGQLLAEAGVKKLEELGATDIFAMVHGDNTSSSKLFSNRGFKLLPPKEQFKRYGVGTLLLWAKTLHFFDVGHFMWCKSGSRGDNLKKRPLTSYLWVLLFHIIGGTLSIIRWQGKFDLSMAGIFSISIGILLSLRLGVMLLVAKTRSLEVEYRVWESGITLNLLISGIFGGIVPAPGSFYPVKENWSYRDTIKDTGLIAFVSNLVLVVLTLTMFFLKETFPILGTPYNIAITLSILDVVIPVFPISCYNGKRVWDWNRALWLLTSLPVIYLVIRGLI